MKIVKDIISLKERQALAEKDFGNRLKAVVDIKREREKALLDYIYFYLKGLRTIDWKDLDIKGINTAKRVI